MINPELKPGDRVVILDMEDKTGVPPGTKGTVISKQEIFGTIHYTVKWDNGSRLAIIADLDTWTTEDDFLKRKKNTNEVEITKKSIIENSEIEKMNILMKNIDVFKHFNMKFFLTFLLMIRDSGIINMFESPTFLYMGEERIKHEFKYKNIPNKEAFDEVLENADKSQSEMINGVLRYLKSENKEESLENINRYLKIFSQKILVNYITLL